MDEATEEQAQDKKPSTVTDNEQTIEGAEGGTDAKWPRPVYFRENDPKKGYVYIMVNVPELTVSKTLLTKNKPENLEVCNPEEVFNQKQQQNWQTGCCRLSCEVY